MLKSYQNIHNTDVIPLAILILILISILIPTLILLLLTRMTSIKDIIVPITKIITSH